MNKVVWSLFDGSGLMLEWWAKAGYKCYAFNADSGNHGEYTAKVHHENITYVNIWIDKTFLAKVSAQGIPSPNIVFGFPDCTFFAQSGSKHERSDDDISTALYNAKLIESIGNAFNCPWMVENPVGKLSTLWRKPDYYFHPYEYGAFLNFSDEVFHPRMPKFDGYTKKTCIWAGNGFEMPEKNPGPVNIGFFWAWKYCGGASPRTKQLRSLTPRGFARAVCMANSPNIIDGIV